MGEALWCFKWTDGWMGLGWIWEWGIGKEGLTVLIRADLSQFHLNFKMRQQPRIDVKSTFAGSTGRRGRSEGAQWNRAVRHAG